MPRAVLFAVLALAATAAHAQLYRWVDQNGKVHYTDQPPPKTAKSVEKKSVGGNVTASEALPFATQQAAKNFPVALYTSETCGGPCNDAKALLQKRGVPYREVVVKDEAGRDQLVKVSGAAEIPVLTVGRVVKRGYEESMYSEALDGAGYPRFGPPLAASAPAKASAAPAGKPAEPAKPEEAPKGPYAPK